MYGVIYLYCWTDETERTYKHKYKGLCLRIAVPLLLLTPLFEINEEYGKFKAPGIWQMENWREEKK